MNKKTYLILGIIVTLVLGGVILLLTIKNNNGVIANDSLSYTIIENGYDSYESKIISNYQDYLDFVDYIDSYNKSYGKGYDLDSKKYDKEYFNKKSIAILNIITGTGMNKLKSIDLSVNGNTLICNANIDYTSSKFVTDDIDGKVILVEIDKSIKKLKINK